MKGPIVIKKIFILLILLIGTMPLVVRQTYGDPLTALQSALPEQIDGWKASPGEDRSYDRETIFDYIDGEGEVYNAYNMRRCVTRRYEKPEGPQIVMDLFDMGSSKDAFGVFTHDRHG